MKFTAVIASAAVAVAMLEGAFANPVEARDAQDCINDPKKPIWSDRIGDCVVCSSSHAFGYPCTACSAATGPAACGTAAPNSARLDNGLAKYYTYARAGHDIVYELNPSATPGQAACIARRCDSGAFDVKTGTCRVCSSSMGFGSGTCTGCNQVDGCTKCGSGNAIMITLESPPELQDLAAQYGTLYSYLNGRVFYMTKDDTRRNVCVDSHLTTA